MFQRNNKVLVCLYVRIFLRFYEAQRVGVLYIIQDTRYNIQESLLNVSNESNSGLYSGKCMEYMCLQ